MIPCGPKMDIRGWGEMNSFNGPNWSLTWEYVANILYALVFRRLGKIALAVLTAEQVYVGLTRLFYPFLSGLLISRIGKYINVKGGFWWCSLILVILFSLPCIGGEGNILNGFYNAAFILVLFPIVVMMGAGSQIKGEKSTKICTFLGELSYPLYIAHYPLMYIQMNWAWSHTDAPILRGQRFSLKNTLALLLARSITILQRNFPHKCHD